jgi:hypothetical protein
MRLSPSAEQDSETAGGRPERRSDVDSALPASRGHPALDCCMKGRVVGVLAPSGPSHSVHLSGTGYLGSAYAAAPYRIRWPGLLFFI